jgi:WD40 repeat protein
MARLAHSTRLVLLLVIALLRTTPVTLGAPRPSADEPSFAFSPDGRTFAALGKDRALVLWDVASGRERSRIALRLGRDEAPEQVLFLPDGSLALLLCQYEGFKSLPDGWFREGTISACVWNINSDKRSPFVVVGYGGLAVCPKGEILAHGKNLWDVASGKKLKTAALPRGMVTCITFSPDGKTVVYQISESLAQDFALLFLADVAIGQKRLVIGEIDGMNQLAECRFYCSAKFSPDGTLVAFSEVGEHALHLRSVAEGKAFRRIALKDWETVIGFSPDGRNLVTWQGQGPVVRIWETASGKERHRIDVGKGVNAVLLSPDGKTVASIKGEAVAFHRLMD